MRTGTLLIGLSALLCALSLQAAEPIAIKFSHVVAADTPKGKAAERFAELAKEKTQGRVEVTVYPNNTLDKDSE